MTSKPVRIACIFAAILLAGCSSSRISKEVARLRLSGLLDSARTRAVMQLQTNPESMNLWRELALTDLDLNRRAVQQRQDALPALLEAALISAAANSIPGNRQNDKWSAVGKIAASEVANYAGEMTNRLDLKQAGHAVYTESGITSNFMDDGDPVIYRQPTREVLIDPALVADVACKTEIMIEFLKRLPCADQKNRAIILGELDKKLLATTERPNISSGFLNDRRKAAMKAVDAVLDQCVEDLKSQGHLDPETIFKNRILE